ncbi:MAG: IS1 family transposase [Bacteroidota bacterium]
MEQCPNCKSTKFCKDGIVKQRQRYKCQECNFRFTVEKVGKPDKLKRDALILYLEGLGFRSIGRFLKVSNVTVLNWIKSFGKNIDDIRNNEDIDVVEIDEMHTYIGSKKTIAGYGLLLIEMGTSSSTAKLARGGQRQEKNFGIKSRIKGSSKNTNKRHCEGGTTEAICFFM